MKKFLKKHFFEMLLSTSSVKKKASYAHRSKHGQRLATSLHARHWLTQTCTTKQAKSKHAQSCNAAGGSADLFIEECVVLDEAKLGALVQSMVTRRGLHAKDWAQILHVNLHLEPVDTNRHVPAYH